jgi:very-short-patch-repair endonuclease
VLVHEVPRVLAVAGAPPSWRRSLRGALLCVGDGAVVSHRSAAALLEFDRSRPGPVEVTMRRAARGRSVPFVLHTTGVLEPIDRIVVDGLPVTSATRTVIDLARARVPTVILEAAIDSAVRSGRSSPVAIACRLDALRGPGRWGAPRLDRLLLDAGGHTALERAFLRVIRQVGLPRPRTQVVHRRGGRHVARVDFLFDEADLVVEVSGRRGHSSPAERSRDAQLRNELQALGRTVYEFTWEDVTTQPGRVVRDVAERLQAVGSR